MPHSQLYVMVYFLNSAKNSQQKHLILDQILWGKREREREIHAKIEKGIMYVN
jgi:hypothetical protein